MSDDRLTYEDLRRAYAHLQHAAAFEARCAICQERRTKLDAEVTGPMTELPTWVTAMVQRSACAACRAPYSLKPLELHGAGIKVGDVAQAWVVAITCTRCDVIGVVTLTRTTQGEDSDARPELDIDDVLDAHDTLQHFRGDVNALFTTNPPGSS